MSLASSENKRAAQLEKLRQLIEQNWPGNQFYRAKFQNQKPVLQDWKEFEALPFTLKTELVHDQEKHPPFGSNLAFPLSHYTRYHQTSGTSGSPLRWLDTPENWNWMVDNWCRIFEVAGVNSSDRIYFAFSFGPFLGFWLAFAAAEKMGALCLPGGGLSSVARLRMILDQEATALCCTPTYALRLAEVAQQENISLADSKVKNIFVAGEPGGSIPSTRQHIEHLWPGSRVQDHHGMTEVGPVTYECPGKPGVLHVLESAYIAEILDPVTQVPCSVGTRGELVLTSLGRTGSPLIRYRTGDLVQASDTCGCGTSDLPLAGGILGRCDDMVVIRGVNIYPSAVESVMRGIAGLAEYRVKVKEVQALKELEVEVEPQPKVDGAQLTREVQRKLELAFSMRILVKAVEPGSLPRFELKAKRWTVMAPH